MENANISVKEIVALFGGIRPMAQTLQHTNHTTVQGWVSSGRIPHWRAAEVIAAANCKGIKLSADGGSFLIKKSPCSSSPDQGEVRA